MAGRAAELSDEQIAAIGADPLPDGVYGPAEEAVVRYARASTLLQPITDELYSALLAHFSERQVIEICFTVGLSNMVNRFHATFHTDVDADTEAALGAVCPVRRPGPPVP